MKRAWTYIIGLNFGKPRSPLFLELNYLMFFLEVKIRSLPKICYGAYLNASLEVLVWKSISPNSYIKTLNRGHRNTANKVGSVVLEHGSETKRKNRGRGREWVPIIHFDIKPGNGWFMHYLIFPCTSTDLHSIRFE